MSNAKKMTTYLLVGEPDRSLDSIYMLKLYDDMAINKDGEQDILRYSKNHKRHVWMDDQSDKFEAVTGYATFVGGADEDFLSYVVDSTDTAMVEFFKYSSKNVANGGNLFKAYDPEEEKQVYVDEYELEEFVREELKNMTIAEMVAIDIALGGKYLSGISAKDARAEVIRHIYSDVKGVAEAMKEEATPYLYYAHKALATKVVVIDNGTINFGQSQIGSLSLGESAIDVIVVKMMQDKEFNAKLSTALKKKK